MKRNLFAALLAFTVLTLAHMYLPAVTFQMRTHYILVSFVAVFIGLLVTPRLIVSAPLVYIVWPTLVIGAVLIVMHAVALLTMVTLNKLGIEIEFPVMMRSFGIVSAGLVGLGTYMGSRLISNGSMLAEMFRLQ